MPPEMRALLNIVEGAGALWAIPTEVKHPILPQRTMTVFRIMDGDQEVGRVADIWAKTPDAAVDYYRRRQEQEQAERVPSPPAPARAEPPAAERRVVPVRGGLLYHFTSPAALRSILAADCLRAETDHIIGGRPRKGVSLTRDAGYDFEEGKPFRLALDAALLRQRHRLIPVRAGEVQHIHKADQSNDQYGNEAEEFVLGAIPHLERCLRGLAVRIDLLDPAFDLDGYVALLAAGLPVEKLRRRAPRA